MNTVNKSDYIILIFALFSFTAINLVQNDNFLIFHFFLLIFANAIRKKLTLHNLKLLFIVLIVFSIINFVSLIFGPFSISTYIGTSMRISIGYLTVLFVGSTMLEKYSNIILIAALVSLPFYLIQLLYPQLFNAFESFSRVITTPERYMSGKLSYLFHTITLKDMTRNCGFAWEPGGFSVLLGITLVYLLKSNNFKIDRKVIIILITALTTFSTTMYLVLISIYSVYSMITKTKYRFILIPIIIGTGVFMFYNLEFLGEKIYKFYIDYKIITEFGFESAYSASGRLVAFAVGIINWIYYPLGQGINDSLAIKNIYGEIVGGPSGLGRFMAIWGIFGMWFLYKSLEKLDSIRFSPNYRKVPLFTIVIIIFLFANPLEWNPYLISLIFYPYIMSRTRSINSVPNLTN